MDSVSLFILQHQDKLVGFLQSEATSRVSSEKMPVTTTLIGCFLSHRGTPKSFIFMGFSTINHPFGYPNLWELRIFSDWLRLLEGTLIHLGTTPNCLHPTLHQWTKVWRLPHQLTFWKGEYGMCRTVDRTSMFKYGRDHRSPKETAYRYNIYIHIITHLCKSPLVTQEKTC